MWNYILERQSLRDAMRAHLGSTPAREEFTALGGDAIPGLLKDARSTEAPAKARALSLLGYSGDRRAIPVLTEALSDTDWSLRWRAARALAETGLPEAVQPLCAALNSGRFLQAQLAAEALEYMARSHPVPELTTALPLLLDLQGRALRGWGRPEDRIGPYRRAFEAIEAATAASKALPVPTSGAKSAAAALPLPVESSPTGMDEFPAPAEQEVVKMDADAPRPSWWRRLLRAVRKTAPGS